jgi:hypothetical protein
MKTDIYKIYKSIKLRSSRNPGNHHYEEMTSLARNLFEGNLKEEELYRIAGQLYEIEKNLYVRTLFSKRIIDALDSGEYSLDRPYQIRHRYENNRFGWVYIASHESKEGQLKIGATTEITKRMYHYNHRYGYFPSIEFQLFCEDPFKLEHDVKNQISDKLYCGCTDGDSNEWYEISLEELEQRIISTDEKRSL